MAVVSIHPAIDHGIGPDGAASFGGGTLQCKCADRKVAVSIKGQSAYNHVCGCTKCWKPVGALFSMVAAVSRDNVSVTANQDKLTEKDLIEHAQKLNLDKAIFEACLKGGKHTERVKLNQSSGEAVGVNGTPAMFINGTLLSGAQPLDAMVEVVESHLKSPSK